MSEEILSEYNPGEYFLSKKPEKLLPPVHTNIQYLPIEKLSWENFEELCYRLVKKEKDVEFCKIYGIKGQKQYGIDIVSKKKNIDKNNVYQCKRVEKFGKEDLEKAINKFLSGKFKDKSNLFVLCFKNSARDTNLIDEILLKKQKLQKHNIIFDIWDKEELSLKLKDNIGIVVDFFGIEWGKVFLGIEIIDNYLLNKYNKFLTLPPSRPVELFGRDDDYKKTVEIMKKENSMLLIHSMGGVGKTELSKKYYWDNYKNFKFSGYINYLNGLKESLVEQFNDDLIEKNENDDYDEIFKKIIRFITKNNKDILLIIDDIDKMEEQDKDLQIIRSLPISILASSRIKLDLFQNILEIGFLDKEACINLFYKIYNIEKDNNYLIKTIELAGFHTLAIELLSKTCKASNLKIKEFYEKLISIGFNLNDVIKEKVSIHWHDETNNKKFFEHILKVFELSNLTKNEIYILTNIAVLPSIPIKKDYLKEWLKINSFDEINSLIKKGWINEIGFEIKMHRIIQEAVIYQTKPNFGTCYMLILFFINKFKDNPEENPVNKKEFIPYAESILNYINENEEMIATLYNNLAYIYQTFGYLEKAKNLQEKSIEILKNCPIIHNENSKATSYNNLASIYKALNNLEKAKEYQIIALEIRERILDKNHPDLATSYNNLSGILHKLGDLDNALAFQQKALKIRENYLPDLANSYNNIAAIYMDLKDLKQAYNFQKRAVDINEYILDKNHPNLAISYNNLAEVLLLQGNIKSALCYQLKTTRIRKRIFDKNHYLIGSSYNNLGWIYFQLKDYKRGIDYTEKAINILKFNFPNGHPDLNMTLNNLKIIKDAKEKNE